MQRIVQSVILILIRWIVIYPMDSAIRRLNNRSLIGQNLTGEFIRKFMQHLETCLLTTEADRVLCHLVIFNCLFLLDVQNEIQLLSWFSYYSWLVCLLGFCLRNAPLVKVIGNGRFRMASFSKMSLLTSPCLMRVRGLKSLKPPLGRSVAWRH